MGRKGMLLGAALLQSFAAFATDVAPIAEQHPLLVLERNRASVVQRIVDQWSSALPPVIAHEAMTREQFADALFVLRADRLLAASLAGSFKTVEALIAEARAETQAAQRVPTKALGDANADLTYTPVTPCRLVDTRVAGGALGGNSARDFKVFATSGGFAAQGGSSGNCSVPANPAAVVLNIAAVNIAGTGNLIAFAAGGTPPNSSVLNYQGGTFAVSNGAIMPACVPDCANQITIGTNGAGADVVIDIVGYFKAPSGAGNFFVQGGNTFGTTAKLGTLNLQPLEIYVGSLRVMRYDLAVNPGVGPKIAGGHSDNAATGEGATVAGGGAVGSCTFSGSTRPCANTATGPGAFVGGGFANIASGQYSVIAGGYLNTVSGQANTIGGGANNTTASANQSTVSGGTNNTASGDSSTVAGGFGNTASGGNSMVAGGSFNAATGSGSAVIGGASNLASGANSFAAGHRAKATASGEFTWADNRNFDWDPGPSWGNNPTNTFNVRATGGVYFVTDINASNGVPTVGCSLQPGLASWTCSSSRDLKTDFERADTQDVLRRVVAMPIERWRFKGEAADVRHMGPVAQDFRAAFGLGYDETTISGIDLDGVALAAIQGLYQEIKKRDAEIAELRRTLDAIAKRVGIE